MNFIVEKILRSNFIKFSRSIAQLLLMSEGDEIWLEFAPIRKSWHYLVLFVMIFFFLNISLAVLVVPLTEDYKFLIFFIRIFDLIGFVLTLTFFLALIYNYYKNLLSTGIDLRFKNIPFFYFGFHLILGMNYTSLYVLNPSLFSCSNSFYVPSPYHITLGIQGFLATWEFIFYTLATSFSLSYPHIESNSAIVSLLNIFQAIMNVIFISFFIATFIQKSSDSKK